MYLVQTKDPKSADTDVIREIDSFAQGEPTITKDALQPRILTYFNFTPQLVNVYYCSLPNRYNHRK